MLQSQTGTSAMWTELVTLYKSVLESGQLEPEMQILLWSKVAQIQESRIGNLGDAAAAWRKVLGIDAHNEQLSGPFGDQQFFDLHA